MEGGGEGRTKKPQAKRLSQWDQNELLGPCQDGRGRGAIWEGKVELQSLKPTDFKPDVTRLDCFSLNSLIPQVEGVGEGGMSWGREEGKR